MMDARVVFLKTKKGEEEISHRTHKLNHALRYVLILVNGKSTVGEIQSKGHGLPNIEGALDALAAQGFIQTVTESKLRGNIVKRDARSEIIELAHSLLADRAGPIIKKLNEAGDTPDALTQTANACKRLIKLTIDDQKAEEFVSRAQEIIFASTLQHQPIQAPRQRMQHDVARGDAR